jgi:lysophospholipase L1-like esterase
MKNSRLLQLKLYIEKPRFSYYRRAKTKLNKKKQLQAVGALLIVVLSGIAVFSLVETKVEGHPIRVACIGDSITYGSGYPGKLDELLGQNYTVANFGVSGTTVTTHSNMSYMDQPQFQQALAYHPDIIVIMLGTNDANSEISLDESSFENDYSQLINSLQELSGVQLIWVVKSPPIFTQNSSYNNTYLQNTILPEIDDLANQKNLPTVDVYSAFGNHSDYFMDGVHPDENGASLIASQVYDAITLPDGSPDTTQFGDGYFG